MEKDSSGHKISTISVRLTPDLKQWLKSYAQDHEIPVNAVIKTALEHFRYGTQPIQFKRIQKDV